MPTGIYFCSYNFHSFRFSRYIHTYFIKTPFNSAFQSQCHDLVNGRLMCIVLYLNIVRLVQITVCFLVTITCQTPPSMCHHTRSWCIQGAVVRYFDIFHQWARTDFKFHFCCVFFFLAENLEIFVGAIWRKMYHYQKNVSQHYYLLDTLVK